MSTDSTSTIVNATIDDCSICLSALAPGQPLLTLSCNHKYHLQCLASTVKAQNKQCPLCRATIEPALTQLLFGASNNLQRQEKSLSSRNLMIPSSTVHQRSNAVMIPPHAEDFVDEESARTRLSQITTTRETVVPSTSTPLLEITATTTMEFGGQISNRTSNIYGLVTLKAPSINRPVENHASSLAYVPIDLVCVVDQSASMTHCKMTLLKDTLVYVIDQLREFDRLAIISFNSRAYDISNGLKLMSDQNQQILKRKVKDGISASGGTSIGSGLTKAIELLTNRVTKNQVSALLLLTDGQDNRPEDYTQLMLTLPESVSCHTFGYGPDHSAVLLAQLAEQGNHGSFTYIDQQQAVGTAFATVLGGLLSCIAQRIRVTIEFNQGYKITNIHSKYKYEPNQLSSSKVTLMLHDLNADEQRNFVFQLFVPAVNEEQSIAASNHTIGSVSLTYIDPGSGRTVLPSPTPFQLIRASQLSPDLLQTNYTVDIQRNRVETANVLKRAMEENNYTQSLALLKIQAEKIKASISAQDPFCQQLIKDLECRYTDERDYRSSNQNASIQHASERGTYSSSFVNSTLNYQSPVQRAYIDQFLKRKN